MNKGLQHLPYLWGLEKKGGDKIERYKMTFKSLSGTFRTSKRKAFLISYIINLRNLLTQDLVVTDVEVINNFCKCLHKELS